MAVGERHVPAGQRVAGDRVMAAGAVIEQQR